MAGIILKATTKNRKTGDIPTVYIGRSREESRKSCEGCGLLKTKTCYAQFGSPSWALSAMEKAINKGKRVSVTPRACLDLMARGAKAVRVGAIGDPARAAVDWLDYLKPFIKEGLTVIGYTHFPDEVPHLKGLFMASASNLEQAAEYLAQGWSVTVPLKGDIQELQNRQRSIDFHGATVTACPAQVSKRISCNMCRLCTPTKGQRLVIFEEHGRNAEGLDSMEAL